MIPSKVASSSSVRENKTVFRKNQLNYNKQFDLTFQVAPDDVAHLVVNRPPVGHLQHHIGRKDALRVAVQSQAKKAIVGGELDANVLHQTVIISCCC